MSAEAEIRQFAERIVRLETERRERADDIKEVKSEAKGRGYNVKLIAACVRLMLLEQDKQDAAIREHSELDIYLGAVGLLDGVGDEPDEDPSFPVAARDGLRSDEPGANASKGVTAGESPGTVSRESADQTPRDAEGTRQAHMRAAPGAPGTEGSWPLPRAGSGDDTEGGSRVVTVGGDESGTAAHSERLPAPARAA